MRKLFKFLLNIIIYIAIVGGLVWGLPKGLSRALRTPYPMASITSGSMWPALKEGDLIFIEGVSRDELKVGDVVVWRNEKGFTIHRIVKLNTATFITKGDGNFQEDEPVAYKELVGRAVQIKGKYARIPYIGFISVAASKYYSP